MEGVITDEQLTNMACNIKSDNVGKWKSDISSNNVA